ncbi:MAG: histone deacetylase [candidate division Zixibacteria bacterium]|nr:histone deacetylase [Gammaproteobacteria bacterium]NIX59305.1 histone deacetylase [candidate division Zixibacteria bacterium]
MDDLIFFYPENHHLHASPNHPERPERIEAIRQSLDEAGLWDSKRLVEPVNIPESVLYAIHSHEHTERVQNASKSGGGIDSETYVTNSSWQLAINAAGGGIAVAEAVYSRKAARGFSLCRPPGHHATRDQAMGFCLLNNVALAAENILQNHPAERVAIIDIDLHHGNGTQDIFYSRPDVFYCSIHQYPLYPMTGVVTETGVDGGEGTNLNIPFPPYAGDESRQAAWERVIRPLLEDFQPDILLVSAGFDAHWRDPLGHQMATVDGYGKLVQKFADFADQYCDGRLAVFLEGGYDLGAQAACARAISQALLNQRWEDTIGPSPLPEDTFWENRLQQVIKQWDLPA